MSFFTPADRKRWARFRRMRRAYWSLVILGGAYFASLGSEFIAGDRPLFVRHEGRGFFPVFFSTLKPSSYRVD